MCRYESLVRFLLLGLLVAAQLQPVTSSATIAAAQAKLQGNDPAAAVAILEPVVAKEPGNVSAWRVLATALQRSKAYDRAVAAFQKILELEPTATQMLYNVGATHALAGNTLQAFEWLERAKGTRRVDMSQVDVDGNLASLTAIRDSPRYARCEPTSTIRSLNL